MSETTTTPSESKPAAKAGWLVRSATGVAKWCTRFLLFGNLAVMTLLALGLGYDAMSDHFEERRIRAASSDVAMVKKGVDQFYRAHQRLPSDLTELVPRYLKEVHDDPWGYGYAVELTRYGYCVQSRGAEWQRHGKSVQACETTLPNNTSQHMDNERQLP